MLRDRLRSLLGTSTAIVHECRHCGRTVDGTTERCPDCGAASIASYPVE